MESPLVARLNHNFTQYADRPCLEYEGRELTYAQMERLTRSLANYFAGQGIRSSDRVGIWMVPCMAFFPVLVALWRMGAVPALLNAKEADQDVAEIIDRAGLCSLLVGTDPPVGGEEPLIGVPEIDALPAGPDALPQTGPISADTLGALLFTSGSTGVPKAVMVSHSALGGNALATAQALGLTCHDRWVFNTPFNFTSAVCHFLTNLMAGAAVKAMDRFCFPDEMVRLLADFGATGFGSSPVQNRWLIEAVKQADQLPALRRAMSSGDVLPAQIYSLFQERLPHVGLFNVFGMTEVGGRICLLAPSDGRIGSVGRPIEGLRLAVRDPDTGQDAEATQVGEVFIQGDYLMDGYAGMPDKTAATLTAHGIRSGDLGYVDEQGFLFLVGRRDDVFKSAGEKVSCTVIEQAVRKIWDFIDLAVVAVPDDYLSRVPKLFYVSGNGGFDRKQLLGRLRKELPDSHLPRLFQAVDQIPRTGSGKVRRRVLEKMNPS